MVYNFVCKAIETDVLKKMPLLVVSREDRFRFLSAYILPFACPLWQMPLHYVVSQSPAYSLDTNKKKHQAQHSM